MINRSQYFSSLHTAAKMLFQIAVWNLLRYSCSYAVEPDLRPPTVKTKVVLIWRWSYNSETVYRYKSL